MLHFTFLHRCGERGEERREVALGPTAEVRGESQSRRDRATDRETQ